MIKVRHLRRQAALAVDKSSENSPSQDKFPGDPLPLLKKRVDEESHIKIKDDDRCHRCVNKPCTTTCSGQVFEWEEDHIRINYPRCMECGACRFFCPEGNILMEYPRGGYGLDYRY